jgi:hypothetical protein
MKKLYYDTETCGFHGLAVLIQFAIGDGEIHLFEPWRKPVALVLELLEWMHTGVVGDLLREEYPDLEEGPFAHVGFNLTFDSFHLNKLYTTFKQFVLDGGDANDIALHNIEKMAVAEKKSRALNICLKPAKALDLMLHSRKGPFQSLMDRSDIRIRRIPNVMAERLRLELERRICLDGIYFARRKDKHAPQWNIYDSKDKDGNEDPMFKDVCLKFHPQGALKTLAEHVLNFDKEDILTMTDVEVHEKFRPKEYGWAPFALAVGRPGRWNWAWPQVIHEHIYHWAFNKRARKYATDDIVYTRGLEQHPLFSDAAPGDDDSELACMVGAVRWRGFEVDLERMKRQKLEAAKRAKSAPTAPSAVKRWLYQVMDDDEQLILNSRGTGDVVLQEISGTLEEHECEHCDREGCDKCEDGYVKTWADYWEDEDGNEHKAVPRARAIREARAAGKEVELYDKIIQAGRFHASFKVIGTLSTRMSGTDGLNPQGIKNSKFVRECFILSLDNDDEQLDGGDFESFEVCISAAVYKDKGLEDDIKSGKKIHALMAEAIFPEQDYDSIMASKGSKSGRDFYTDGKRAVFGLNYGGDANTLVNRLGVTEEVAAGAFERFEKRYPGVGRARQNIINRFCSMRQPGGIGSRVEWHDPDDKIESLLGFPRYFTLENQICKALFDLAAAPPREWKEIRVKVVRRDRQQTAGGACQSALYGAAFGLQGSNMRAAANHVIQSTGAGVTKRLQRRIWDHQPYGVGPFKVAPLNIHDEVMSVDDPKISDAVTATVFETVEEFRPIIPLIAIDWGQKLTSWASK